MLSTEKLNIAQPQASDKLMLKGVVVSFPCFLSAMLLLYAATHQRIYAGKQPRVLVTRQDIEAQLSSTDKGHVYSSLYLRQCVSLQCVCTVPIRDRTSNA